jgi:hypothetical protein
MGEKVPSTEIAAFSTLKTTSTHLAVGGEFGRTP